MSKLSEVLKDEKAFLSRVEKALESKKTEPFNTDVPMEEQLNDFNKFSQSNDGVKAMFEDLKKFN